MPRPRPPKSDLEKAHDAERMKRDFKVLACSAKRDDAEKFADYCKAKGTSVHAELLAYVQQCIK